MYEGLWKIDSLKTAKPWTAAGYLKNARGPFRSYFREMTGDPDELGWLDVDNITARWDAWHERFLAKYPDLTDTQKRRLDEALNGKKEFAAVLEQLPEGVEFRGSLGGIVRFNAKRKRLLVDGEKHLLPRERARLLAMVPVTEGPPGTFTGGDEADRAYAVAVRRRL